MARPGNTYRVRRPVDFNDHGRLRTLMPGDELDAARENPTTIATGLREEWLEPTPAKAESAPSRKAKPAAPRNRARPAAPHNRAAPTEPHDATDHPEPTPDE